MDDHLDDLPFVTDDNESYWSVDWHVWVVGIVVGILVFLAFLVFKWLFG